MTLRTLGPPARRLLGSPAAILVSRLAAAVLGLATSVIVARGIGMAGRGLTAAVIAALIVVPLVSGLGLSWAVRRETVLAADPAPILRTARLLSVASSVPAAVATAVLLGTTLDDLSAGMTATLLIGMAVTPAVVLRNARIGVLMALGRFGQAAVTTLAQPVLYTALVVGAALRGGLTPTLVVVLFIASVIGSAVLTAGFVRTPWRGPRVPAPGLLRTSMRSVGAQLGEILSHRLDQLLLLPLIGAGQLGAYAVAVNVALAPAPIGQAVAAGSFPSMTLASAQQRRALVRESVGGAAALAVLAGLGVLVVAPSFPWVLGPEFAAAQLPAVVMALGTWLVVVAAPATSALLAAGRGGSASAAQLAGTVVGIAAMYLLAPAYGAVGAALAAVAGYLVTLGITLWRLRCPAGAALPRVGAGARALQRLVGRGAVPPREVS